MTIAMAPVAWTAMKAELVKNKPPNGAEEVCVKARKGADPGEQAGGEAVGNALPRPAPSRRRRALAQRVTPDQESGVSCQGFSVVHLITPGNAVPSWYRMRAIASPPSATPKPLADFSEAHRR